LHCNVCKQAKEADILERIEKMCDPDQDAGDWITQLDIVENEDKLLIKDTGLVSTAAFPCLPVQMISQSYVGFKFGNAADGQVQKRVPHYCTCL
jgi:hypothetical protein